MSQSESPPTWDLASSVGSSQTIAAGDAQPFAHPTEVGPYRILSVLGEGGMGLVYVAEQREPVQRRVALKVIKLGMDTREVVARFSAERQALALMDHPNIARVYDAGATDTGRPFFVMELVSGVPITRFCDEQKLATRQRLELFATVCDAVQHAHAKGIIHRDIKPGNVLVTLVDGKPMPKVIDFGIAKATNQRLTERTVFTELGRMVGTPEYMSPEQAESAQLDIDTRTDVYSLGVLLYELLTGTLPFEPKDLRSRGFDAISQMIRQLEPPRPSTRLGKLNATDAALRADRRGETIDSLTTHLRRELEWIPLKAMRKEREHRYRTASELADDVRNYLVGRPLIAGPETRSYRARKFLRRNRAPVVAASIMLLLLVGGIVATTFQAIRATRAERQAQRAERDAQQRFNDVRSLASNLILELHPQIEKLAGSSGAMKQLLDTSLTYLNKLAAQSSNDPVLLQQMSTAYQKLGDIQGNPNVSNRGDTAAAAQSYERARQMAQQGLAVPTVSPLERTKLLNALAGAEMKVGDILLINSKPGEALARFVEAARIMSQLAAAEPQVFRARFNEIISIPRISNAHAHLGDLNAAIETTDREVKLAQALVSEFPDQAEGKSLLASAYRNLTDMQQRAGRHGDAIKTHEGAVAIYRDLAKQDPDNAITMHRLGNANLEHADILATNGQNDGALEYCARALEIAQKLVASDPQNLRSRDLLGRSLTRSGDFSLEKGDNDRAAAHYTEAIDLYRKSLEIAPGNSGASQMLLVTYGQLAELERRRGRFGASLAAHAAGIDLLMPMINAAPRDLRLRGGLVYALRAQSLAMISAGQPEQAVPKLREALESAKKIIADAPGDDGPKRQVILVQDALADALAAVADRSDRSADQRVRDRAEARGLWRLCIEDYEKRIADGSATPPQLESLRLIEQKIAALDSPSTRPTTKP